MVQYRALFLKSSIIKAIAFVLELVIYSLVIALPFAYKEITINMSISLGMAVLLLITVLIFDKKRSYISIITLFSLLIIILHFTDGIHLSLDNLFSSLKYELPISSLLVCVGLVLMACESLIDGEIVLLNELFIKIILWTSLFLLLVAFVFYFLLNIVYDPEIGLLHSFLNNLLKMLSVCFLASIHLNRNPKEKASKLGMILIVSITITIVLANTI